jgi:hypothetical protein
MPADHMDAAEIIAAINEYVGDDKAKAKEFAKALRARAGEVAVSLINIGKSQGTSEAGGEVKKLEAQVKELTEALEAKEQEMADFRAKTPDAATIEESTRKKWESKLRKAETERDDAHRRFNDAVVQIGIDKAVALLITPNEQGVRADREYAELIAAGKLRPHFVPKPDGSLAVKQIGEETEYDGDTLDAKVAALVKDFRPYIPATFLMSNADGGAGVRSGPGGGVTGSPGMKTFNEIVDQKRSSPAFAGI